MEDKRSLGARTLLFPTPALVVGSYDADDRPDVMTVAWGGICCSKPPSVMVSIRPSRLTYANIMLHRAFTVSVPGAAHVREVDYIGQVSGRDADMFAVTGLTPVPAGSVHAPYVGEFPVALECRVTHVVDLGAHTLFVGEILDVKADATALDSEGKLDIEAIGLVTYIPGLERYFGLGPSLGKAFEVGKAFRSG